MPDDYDRFSTAFPKEGKREENNMVMKQYIKHRRQELGLTLDDVAKVVGVTRQTIQKYESGVVANIPSDRIEMLARALKTSPARLMGWDEKETLEKELTQMLRKLHEITAELSPESQEMLLKIAQYYRDIEQRK